MSLEECLHDGLIKKSGDAPQRVAQSLLIADRFLKSAGKNFEFSEFEVCEIIAYNALFHCARALLFKKGYIERSHACLFVALLELYPEHSELIRRANKMRVERHGLQYAGFTADESSASFALELANSFGSLAKKILSS